VKTLSAREVDCRAYVQQVLVPQLQPGDIVIMNNLGSHKSAALRSLIKAAGARLWYLPPYSPDLDPIEQTFAKIKHWMRRSARSTTFATISAASSQPSSQTNAATTSKTPDTLLSKRETLTSRISYRRF
jgi:transposase